MNRQEMREQFLADVASHQMTVHRDDGMYRHLEFRKPGSGWHQWFEIVTWPMGLAVRGDMGSWMFSRDIDMFAFFRSTSGTVNPQYWAEKCIAEDRERLTQRWDFGAFKDAVIGLLDNWELSPVDRDEVTHNLEESVLCWDERHRATEALLEFESNGVSFDSDSADCGMVWSRWFLWCLHAIVWGIQRYDRRSEGTS